MSEYNDSVTLKCVCNRLKDTQLNKRYTLILKVANVKKLILNYLFIQLVFQTYQYRL